MHTVYICDAVRTPFGRYGGTLAAVRTDDLAAVPIAALVSRNPGLDVARVDDVIYGCANQAGEDNRNVGRMALLLAGLPKEVPGSTVNRLCGSSLDAVVQAARAIASGEMALVIAGGVESMSRAPYVIAKADAAFARGLKLEDTTLGWRFINPKMHQAYGTEAMGETAEAVAEEWRIARADQDAFAFRSQKRAAAAHAAGRLADEIVPVEVAQRKGSIAVALDEHPRADTTLEALAALKPIIKPNGTVTAGNASGINDGACAVLLASEAAVKAHGLTPRARYVAGAVAGVAPRVMGIGPVPATRKVLALAGLGDRADGRDRAQRGIRGPGPRRPARPRGRRRRGARESQRRRDRARSPARRERRPARDDRHAAAGPDEGSLCALHDVHRRRPGD